jgi:hypothetical protein
VSRIKILGHPSLLPRSDRTMRNRSRRIKSNPEIEKKISFPYFITYITMTKFDFALVDRHKIHNYHSISVNLSLMERRVFQVEEYMQGPSSWSRVDWVEDSRVSLTKSVSTSPHSSKSGSSHIFHDRYWYVVENKRTWNTVNI